MLATQNRRSVAGGWLLTRPFLVGLTLLSALALTLPSAPICYAAAPGEETRALWVVRHAITTPGRVDRVVDLAAEVNVNTLLVQVRGRGDAYYDSEIVPRAEDLDAESRDFDPLDRIVRRAHAAGLEVQAWINVYLVWSKGDPPVSPLHVVNAHPDWISVRADGTRLVEMLPKDLQEERLEGMYLSPGIPEVRRHLRDIVREIVTKYRVDGIHLDYVRYPEPGVGYDAATRTAFMREYGVDPIQFDEPDSVTLDIVGEQGIPDLRAKWIEWKRAQVTALVRDIRNDLDVINPRLKLTAAVIADQSAAVNRYGQMWTEWLREGIVDAAIPMAYSKDTPVVVRQIEAARSIPTERHVYAGIGIYNQSARSACEKIRKAREQGVDGIALFSYDALEGRAGYARSVRQWAFRERVRPEPMPWREGR